MNRALAIATLTVPLIAGAPARPDWRAFADCAAAYQANAKIADPERSAAMTAQISEVGDDYRKAAVARLRLAGKASAAAAGRSVAARVAERTAAFATQPRADVEKFIEACPQTD